MALPMKIAIGGLLAEHVPQAHCGATRHTDLLIFLGIFKGRPGFSMKFGPGKGGCMADVDS